MYECNITQYFKVTCICLALLLSACSTDGWQTASREPAGIAPAPEETETAVVQIYAADAWGWRGIFAVHTWIAVKPTKANTYTIYEVVGWRVDSGSPALRVYNDKHPDRFWYGAEPELVWSTQGVGVDKLIDDIVAAADKYPWKNQYKVFPGPNSNTFPAWIIQEVDNLDVDLPWRAIGSGYADNATGD